MAADSQYTIMSGKAPRRKGFGFEREVVNLAREHGLEARRAYGSNGQSLGMHAEVDLLINGMKLQAKRTARLAAKYRPSTHVDATVFREDRGRSFVMLPLETLLDLLKR